MTSPPARPLHGGSRRPRFARTLSLERKLPILMTALLAVILAASLVLTYRTLTRSAESAARERLTRAARQVATTVERATHEQAAVLREMAADDAIRARLRGAARDTAGAERRARGALARLLRPADSSLAAELWDAQGRRLTFVGPDRRRSGANAPRIEALAGAEPGAGPADSGAVRFGPMYGEGGRVYFWGVAPVLEKGARLGYVARQRRVGGPREASRSLQELIGEDVALYLRNAAGTLWASSPGVPVAPPVGRDSGSAGVGYVRPGTGRAIAGEAAVGGTPWLVVLETPARSVRARARRTLVTLTLLSLTLTAVGAVASWAISRRITRPLASLTTAAESISRGDYSRRVEAAGDDELGRLSAAFDQMADEVAASRRELERRVEATQAGAAALERVNQRLQAAIREAEQARVEAERANQAKGDFLAMMSHELRTPLNAIGGYAQLVEMGVHGPVTDAQRDALVRIARSQQHLLGLINSVLNFARIDAGQVEYAIDDVPLDETIASLEPLVAPQMRAKALAFAYRPCGPLLTARADREKLQQVVLNLLTNAIKFTGVGGSVTVECDAAADAVRVHVRDNGVGVPPERLRSIFEPFVQADRALNRPNDGVGLGLAISRDLARGMGGELTVESTVGVGSVFTLALPRAAGAPALPLGSTAPAAPSVLAAGGQSSD
ncbi:MAG TPA: ATP-binding protein [Gemmatimonadaceae bacterium]|nr:ATP-binding protein [Gemmatimonadaceae bacterium]